MLLTARPEGAGFGKTSVGWQAQARCSDEAIASVQPLFDVMGKTTWRLGADQRMAHVAKIAGNLMITQAIESMAEATALTEAYGLSAEVFLGVVTQTMFASPSYQRYARNIAHASYEPGFKLFLGLKDVNLARDAAESAALELPAMSVVRESLSRAASAGLGNEDWSALAKVVRGEVSGESATVTDECGVRGAGRAAVPPRPLVRDDRPG
ncbi:NAD-binding of NADP-dependent 3-hydroxyisobutyrate dehydrogenase [Luteibacter sp. 22Crub2.1]|nr:NAD-binding of NADP-dependent 3-hydroxyisobutyrate dehydrogenase [Luteibacter sp. 22Crub2.1]